MKRWILFASAIAMLSIVSYAQDWNWMDCHNHGYYTRINGTYQCVCNKGWTGDDCAMCANDAVCAPGQVCDRSFAIKGYKSFNCTPAGADIGFLQGCFTAQWDFPPPVNGTVPIGQGNITSYDGPIGAPFVFNCSFTDCTQDISDGINTISCQHTSCYCSSWCSTITRNIIHQMKGYASFICWEKLGNCTLSQEQLPLVLEVGCTAAGCQQGPYIPPPPDFNHTQVALIASVTTLCILCLIAAIALSCLYSKRKQYEAFVKSRGHHFHTILSYNDLSCVITDGKRERVVLHPASGVMAPGHVTAIMGPSGAGKTTFLDILAGRKNVGKLSGDILVNGLPRPHYFQRISGYVLQDEKFIGTFTVKEHLMFVAQLRLPSGMPKVQKEERVRGVLEELGIAHIANSPIGTDTTRGISGGERKRLAIACELLTDPSLLFLDEPTSGLDSYNAFTLLQTLTNLAKNKNRNIITTIHQPRSNIYSLFDHVVLISQGHVVFNGPASDVLPHFETLGYQCPENYNPADFMIDLVEERQESVPDMARKFKESSHYTNLRNQLTAQYESTPPKTEDPFQHRRYLSTWYDQAFILSKRTTLHILRNPYLLRAQYLMYAILGVLIGGIFWHVQNNLQGVQDRAGSLFFVIALISFSSLSSVDTFFQDRAIFVRERANGMYRTSSYFIAKALCDILPMRILPPFILGAICYYMIGYQVGYWHFLKFQAILVLVSLVSSTMALAISSVTPSVGLGNLIHILLLLFSLLFGGFLVNKSSMPPWVGWLKWASFLNFAFEVLLVNELHGLIIMFDPVGYHMNPVPVAGDVFLVQFDMDLNRVGLDYALLGGMAVLFALVSYFFLRFANKERR